MSCQPIVDLVARYGRNVHSFMVLEPGLSYWQSPGGGAAVAYVDQGGYWVAAGAPLGPTSARRELSLEFARAARRAGRKAVFFGVSDLFWKAVRGPGFDCLKIGEQPLWDPQRWRPAGGRLRNRLNQARRQGVTVALERPEAGEVEPLLQRWQSYHRLPPLHFMARLDLFGHQGHRYYLAARQAGRLVGLAVAVPIYGRRGWLLEDLVVERSAAQGISESLIDAFMRESARRGAGLVSLGLVPLAGLDRSSNPHHRWLNRLLLLAGRLGRGWYDAEGLLRFRQKLRPHRWESVYLVAPGRVDCQALGAVLRAFAGGGLAQFAWRALTGVRAAGLEKPCRRPDNVSGPGLRHL